LVAQRIPNLAATMLRLGPHLLGANPFDGPTS
jgi:hypothetical protein